MTGLVLLLLFFNLSTSAQTVEILDGIREDGTATDLWLAMAQKRHPAAFDEAKLPKPMTDAERAWAKLIHTHATQWPLEIPALAQNFRGIEAPAIAFVVIGNRGGEDAFTHDPVTIGFDVSRLLAEYGEATKPENEARIDRFFRHEYTHLLQKHWFAKHPYAIDTPLLYALAEMWTEGLGNYYSLSDRWRNGSELAGRTLETLTPRLVARLAALACTQSYAMTSGLSQGKFEQKWGALPMALWLDADARLADDALREFVGAGPEGVWSFVETHLSESSGAVLREARLAAELCSEPHDHPPQGRPAPSNTFNSTPFNAATARANR